jgi:hypothetical protein
LIAAAIAGKIKNSINKNQSDTTPIGAPTNENESSKEKLENSNNIIDNKWCIPL